MDFTMIIGMVLTMVVILGGIVVLAGLRGLANFWDIPSIMLTVFPTLLGVFSSCPTHLVMQVPKHIGIALGKQKFDPIYYINTITDLSQDARKKGLLALEDRVAEFEDPFFRDSVMLIVDAMEPDKVREQLEGQLYNIENRHAQVWAIYDKGAAMAPAFGMAATMISLVNMLKNLNFSDEGGAESLGANMSMAMITTFYGSLMANVLFLPIGTRLRSRHNDEMLCKEIIIEGIISIQAGENPRHINEKLMGFLTYNQREKAVAGTGEAAEN